MSFRGGWANVLLISSCGVKIFIFISAHARIPLNSSYLDTDEQTSSEKTTNYRCCCCEKYYLTLFCTSIATLLEHSQSILGKF